MLDSIEEMKLSHTLASGPRPKSVHVTAANVDCSSSVALLASAERITWIHRPLRGLGVHHQT